MSGNYLTLLIGIVLIAMSFCSYAIMVNDPDVVTTVFIWGVILAVLGIFGMVAPLFMDVRLVKRRKK